METVCYDEYLIIAHPTLVEFALIIAIVCWVVI